MSVDREVAGGDNFVGISIYQPATSSADEIRLERAVLASRALTVENDPVLNAIVQRARRAAGTRMAAVSIVHRDWQFLIAAAGLATGAYSRRTSFCGHAILGRTPVFSVLDAREDGRFAGNPAVEDGAISFYVGALIFGEDGDLPIGTLCAFDPRPRTESTGALRIELLALAGQVTAHLLGSREQL